MITWKTKKVDGVKGIVLREIDREFHELPETALGADVTLDKDGKATKVVLAEERFLPFTDAGKRVAAKRLYTVKAEKPDGTVVQLPLEGQINNNIAAPDMFIGLQFYTRKGFNVFFDLETGISAHCPTWDCWAEWNDEFEGFCTAAHQAITMPSDGAEGGRGFGSGATTSRTWG